MTASLWPMSPALEVVLVESSGSDFATQFWSSVAGAVVGGLVAALIALAVFRAERKAARRDRDIERKDAQADREEERRFAERVRSEEREREQKDAEQRREDEDFRALLRIAHRLASINLHTTDADPWLLELRTQLAFFAMSVEDRDPAVIEWLSVERQLGLAFASDASERFMVARLQQGLQVPLDVDTVFDILRDFHSWGGALASNLRYWKKESPSAEELRAITENAASILRSLGRKVEGWPRPTRPESGSPNSPT